MDFAVVADEVRNLAIQAAESAKNTSNLIGDTVKRINNGSNIVTQTSDAFSKVSISSKKVYKRVGEITKASGDQAQGIEQLNNTVSEMDRVIQRNAGNAESSAGTSEELSTQVAQTKASIDELVTAIGLNQAQLRT